MMLKRGIWNKQVHPLQVVAEEGMNREFWTIVQL